VDGQPLIRHEPVIQFGDALLACPRGHRIRVDLGSSNTPLVRDLSALPQMSEVLPDRCQLAEEFREPSDPQLVSAVLDITHGRVEATPPPGLEAELARLEGARPSPRRMAGDFFWTAPMKDDEKVRISLEPMGGSPSPVTIIEADGRSGAGNLLLGNRTAQIGGKQPDPPREDYDFLWYYELLASGTRASVKRVLKKEKRKAPVPICVEGCGEGRSPGNVSTMSISGQPGDLSGPSISGQLGDLSGPSISDQPGDFTIMSISGQKCRPCVFC